jgi:hypothetical protein
VEDVSGSLIGSRSVSKTKPPQMFLRRGATSWSRPFRLHACSSQRPLLFSNIRQFTSTPRTEMAIPSPESQISRMLKELNHDKWGFVIYRCTYKNDQDWNRFKQLVHDRTKQLIAESDTPEIADSLEWTFVEDRAAFEGASRPQLRDNHGTPSLTSKIGACGACNGITTSSKSTRRLCRVCYRLRSSIGTSVGL